MIELRVQTTPVIKPEDALRHAVKNLQSECKSMLEQFDEGCRLLGSVDDPVDVEMSPEADVMERRSRGAATQSSLADGAEKTCSTAGSTSAQAAKTEGLRRVLEWGVPIHGPGRSRDNKLFEMLSLEGAQAGLSWDCILRKRQAYRRAFDHFDLPTVAAYSPKKDQVFREQNDRLTKRRTNASPRSRGASPVAFSAEKLAAELDKLAEVNLETVSTRRFSEPGITSFDSKHLTPMSLGDRTGGGG
eukprot:g11307.t1